MVRCCLSFFSLFLCVSIFSGCAFADGYARKRKMDEVSREMAKTRNQQIEFFGQVVDLDGQPVKDAEVRMSIRVFGVTLFRSNFILVEAKTDTLGMFTASGFGELIALDGISKGGYKYSHEFNHKRSLHSKVKEKRKGIGYEPDKPMIFKIRKKHPPSYSLSGTGGRFELRPGENHYWDMYMKKTATEKTLMQRELFYKNWHPDVKVSAEQDGSGFRLILESLDPDSGFAISTHRFEDEFRKAPENGYKPKLVIPIKEGKAGSLHVYVKNEGGLFYSRLSVSYAHREGNDYVKFEGRYSTNMTGGRVFESDAEFNERYSKLRAEVKAPPLIRKHLRDGTIVLPVEAPEK